MTTVTYRGVLTKDEPHKSLTKGVRRSAGRNNAGRITTRHKGGGHKRLYREIDFKYDKKDIPAKIESIEYDPNRSAFISLVLYADGERRYIVAIDGMKVGDTMMVSEKAEIKKGNRLPLKKIPVGTFVHNVELTPGQGGKFARSAGSAVQLLAKEGENAILKMPSGETRLVCLNSWATIGTLANADYKNISLGKAGRSRHKGFRPTVRGMAMNPVDHPHGGGEGRSKSGSHPMTPWGKGCKGRRTRRRKSAAILKRRKK